MKFEIKHHYSNEILFTAEVGSLKLAVELAVKSKANLSGASLDGASLDGASLDGASLRGASLDGAFLRGASLDGAFLRGASLDGAFLRGAKNIWQSHDIIAEILRREAGDDIEKRKLAGLILISRDWCWKDFLRRNDPLKQWAIDTLRAFASDDDVSVPDAIKRKEESSATQT